jgi:hypothetical protein
MCGGVRNQGRQIDYVVVVFGGAAAYVDDDMNKLLWMAQAAGAAAPPLLTEHGEFRVDADASAALHRCLLYRCPGHESRQTLCCAQMMCRLSYHRFGSLRQGLPAPASAQQLLTLLLGSGQRSVGGFDRVRGAEIGKKDIQLEHVRRMIAVCVSAVLKADNNNAAVQRSFHFDKLARPCVSGSAVGSRLGRRRRKSRRAACLAAVTRLLLYICVVNVGKNLEASVRCVACF